jgi:hypothetical protein
MDCLVQEAGAAERGRAGGQVSQLGAREVKRRDLPDGEGSILQGQMTVGRVVCRGGVAGEVGAGRPGQGAQHALAGRVRADEGDQGPTQQAAEPPGLPGGVP